MPIYEYQYADYGHIVEESIEVLQKMMDAPVSECLNSNQSSIDTQLTAAALKFKGTASYETDFKNLVNQAAINTAKTKKTTAMKTSNTWVSD